ncbi:MAG: hypothetical protein IPL98_07645 [Saprospiraceae bacterium]|nr:hypothetical protein [Saprospiraceae bacterium]
MHHEYKTIKHELICLFENKTIQELADDLVGGDALAIKSRINRDTIYSQLPNTHLYEPRLPDNRGRDLIDCTDFTD